MKKLIKLLITAPWRNKFVFHKLKSGENKIAITFDDGPHPENTVRLLEILNNEKAKATFFVSGSEVEKYPGLLKDIDDEGHEIGNHSFSHRKVSEMGLQNYLCGIEKTSMLIQRYSRQKDHLFRPPFGEFNFALFNYIIKSRFAYVSWSIDSQDSYIRKKDELVQSMNGVNSKDGDIILFHEDYKSTIDALPEIIRDIRMCGFTFASVSELLRIK